MRALVCVCVCGCVCVCVCVCVCTPGDFRFKWVKVRLASYYCLHSRSYIITVSCNMDGEGEREGNRLREEGGQTVRERYRGWRCKKASRRRKRGGRKAQGSKGEMETGEEKSEKKTRKKARTREHQRQMKECCECILSFEFFPVHCLKIPFPS